MTGRYGALARSGWRFVCRFYYADGVAAPKRPGDLAIETVHKDELSRDMELRAGLSRRDIGRVETFPIGGTA